MLVSNTADNGMVVIEWLNSSTRAFLQQTMLQMKSKGSDNKSAASAAPCPTLALTSSKYTITLSKIKSKERCISLSLNRADMNI